MVLVIFFLFFIFQLSALEAKDLGTHGMIYPIQEENPIAMIQQKLQSMEDSGELTRKHKKLQNKAKLAIERPHPVEGISRATESRIFTYDPTYVVRKDIKDHLGKVLFTRGTKVNPLETAILSSQLLFIDGDDAEQTEFVRSQLSEKIKVILVKGAPLELSKKLGIPIYFDQGGLLTTKLGVTHVPALVKQERKSLLIEEICLKKEEETHE